MKFCVNFWKIVKFKKSLRIQMCGFWELTGSNLNGICINYLPIENIKRSPIDRYCTLKDRNCMPEDCQILFWRLLKNCTARLKITKRTPKNHRLLVGFDIVNQGQSSKEWKFKWVHFLSYTMVSPTSCFAFKREFFCCILQNCQRLFISFFI